MMNALYAIETKSKEWKHCEYSCYYRYRSLFNNSIGAWRSDRSLAIKEGEKHQDIINNLFNKQNQK